MRKHSKKGFKGIGAAALAAVLAASMPSAAFAGQWAENGQAVTRSVQNTIQEDLLEKILEPPVRELEHGEGSHGVKMMGEAPEDMEYIGYLLNNEMYLENSILFGTPADYMFDKNKVYQVMEDIYGVQVSEAALKEKDPYDFYIITDDKIGVQGADGEASPSITIEKQEMEEDRLVVSFSYVMCHSVSELDYEGNGTAVFVYNPNSFMGYTLESVQI